MRGTPPGMPCAVVRPVPWPHDGDVPDVLPGPVPESRPGRAEGAGTYGVTVICCAGSVVSVTL